MDAGVLLCLILLFAILGCLAGIGTGLVPGVHMNSVALLMLAVAPAALPALDGAVGGYGFLLLAAFLAAATVAHGMAAILPSVFLGAPDPDTALSVLPGHRLLGIGKGHEAALLGVRGAFFGVLLSLPIVLPFRLFLGPPVSAFDRLRPFLPLLLLLLVAMLLVTERAADPAKTRVRRATAIALLLLSGVLGWTVLRPGFLRGAWAPVPLGTDSLVLFPLFTGLFGLPTLLLSARSHRRLPPQDLGHPDSLPDWRWSRGLLSGTLAGAAVSWFPGLGGTNATIVAQLLSGGGETREADPDVDREFLFAAGAANAATTVFTFATLFVILRARSGAAVAVESLAGGVTRWETLRHLPIELAAVLLGLGVSAIVASLAVSRLARPFAVRVGRIRYGRLALRIAVALSVAVFLVTGPLGLLVLATATALGLVAPLVGARRVHLMGCLLVPILLSGVGV